MQLATFQPLLAPLALAYEGALSVRRRLYGSGTLRSRRLEAPVISVGNLVVGGVGKTPLVIWMARWLRDRGKRVAVLSRGYGRRGQGLSLVADYDGVRCRSAAEAGDEPLLIAREAKGVAVVVHEDRAAAGRHAEAALGPDVHLLDDGFQHLGLERDLDVLVLDAAIDHARLRLLPAGPLREPLSAIRRAGVVLVAGADARSGAAEALVDLVRSHHPGVAVHRLGRRFPGLVDRDGEEHPVAAIRGRRVLALAAIARPERFAADLARLGATVAATRFFRDHHRFARADLGRLERARREARADLVVTTMKDLVRLEALPLAGLPLLALRMEAEIDDPEVLGRRLLAVLDRGDEA